MQKQEYEMSSLALQLPENMALKPIALPRTPQQELFTFSFDTTKPPVTDPATIMQRADEVSALQRMLGETQTSVVTLTGYPGAGKATLATLLYQRLQLAAQSSMRVQKHLVWLRIGPYSTLPDVIAAILSSIHGLHDPALFLQTAEQQIDTLIHTLSRPQESALIVLDAFDRFLHPNTNVGLAERGAISLFLERLQTNLGGSRILLIGNRSPYNFQNAPESRVRSYLVSRINIPEGVALLQRRGVQGSYEDLSLVWQRCAGHAYSLVLFSTLYRLSRFPLSYFLHSPECYHLWHGEVTPHLVAAVYQSLNPMQHTLMRIFSIFDETVPIEAIAAMIAAEQKTFDLVALQKELSTLLRLALVRQTLNRHNAPCYWLHPLLQQYSIDHYLSGIEQQQSERISTNLGVSGPITPIIVDEETEQVALATAHMHAAAYYQQLAAEQHIPQEQRTGVQDIEPILSTIHHLCLGWHWQQACDLLLREGFYESMTTWGAWNTLVNLYNSMIPPTGVLTRHDEALVYNHLGLLYERLGKHQRSYTYYEQALALQRKIGDMHGEATSLTNEGELFRILDARERARTNFERARQLNKTLQDTQVEIVAQHNLGLLYFAEKNYAPALRCYQDALQLAEREHYDTSTILTNIGVLLFEQGYQTEALAIMLYVLKARERLQYSTIDFIKSFTETLKNTQEPHVFAQMSQAALAMQEQIIARLLA
ncbi:MAG TPA: tetratricopeptide repeat protein [Ktedonobacteraceae bacterium]|nr:tetratricopeptide repeat protein [Ktedonobacteraceae bacterium]